jgi:hypothetical protein
LYVTCFKFIKLSFECNHWTVIRVIRVIRVISVRVIRVISVRAIRVISVTIAPWRGARPTWRERESDSA